MIHSTIASSCNRPEILLKELRDDDEQMAHGYAHGSSTFIVFEGLKSCFECLRNTFTYHSTSSDTRVCQNCNRTSLNKHQLIITS